MRLRAPSFDDARAVLAVIAARDIADIGTEDYTFGDLIDEWRGSSFDLGADAVVVEDGGELVGYGCVNRPGSLIVVAPGHEDRDVGEQLLQWTERRERERKHDQHRQWIASTNERDRAMLLAAGYRHVRSYWRLVRGLEGFSDAPTLPADYRLRAIDPAHDARTLHAVDAAAFSSAPDYDPVSLDEFTEEHLKAHDFDPDLSCVAEHGQAVVGFAISRRWVDDAAGFVDILAVRPDHQRRGLGATLLLEAFRRFAGAGLSEAQLGVASDNPRALALYERAGMHSRFQYDTYERPIVGAGPG
jgi:mycothiol synthase